MTAYIIAQVDIHDPERFREYQQLAFPAVEQYGGTFLCSSDDMEVFESTWRPPRIVVVAFDNLDQCRVFYDSPEYQAAIRARKGAAKLDIVALQGDAIEPEYRKDSALTPVYTVSITHVTDPEQYERYKLLSKPSVEKFGGRYLARGGDMALLEGQWTPPRIVLIEFPSLAKAQAWYASPDYTEARSLREGAGTVEIVAVEGLRTATPA